MNYFSLEPGPDRATESTAQFHIYRRLAILLGSAAALFGGLLVLVGIASLALSFTDSKLSLVPVTFGLAAMVVVLLAAALQILLEMMAVRRDLATAERDDA